MRRQSARVGAGANETKKTNKKKKKKKKQAAPTPPAPKPTLATLDPAVAAAAAAAVGAAPCGGGGIAMASPLTQLVDVDANFLHEALAGEVGAHLAAAAAVGVAQFVTPACCLRDCASALALSQQHPGVIFATAGVHPYWTAAEGADGTLRDGGAPLTEAGLAQLAAHAAEAGATCVGECGLDASEGFPPLAAQVPAYGRGS